MTRLTPLFSRETCRDRRGRSRSARRRMAVEILECRALLAGDPTAYLVNLTSAVGAGSGAAGDLAYVVGRANADADPDGSVIRFDPAVFSTPQTITLTATLILSQTAGPIAIEGPGAGLLTISGGDAVRVFRVDAGVTASMSGLTIADGHDGRGGGILNAGTLAVSQVTFDGNRAVGLGSGDGLGGGISNAGILTISDAAFVQNSAIGGRTDDGWSDGDGYGGAVYNTGTLSMTGGRFDDNLARDGAYMGYGAGGAVFNAGMLTITGAAFNGNSAQGGAPLWFPLRGDGGAIYNSGTATLSRSSLNGNRAIYGGGISNSARLSLFDVSITGGGAVDGGGVNNSGTATIQGGTISANHANGTITTKYWDVTDCAGGGIANSGSMTIVNATIAGNTASIMYGRGEKALGGGVANFGALLLVYTTIADNTADTDGGGVWTSGGEAVTTSGASLFRNANGGNIAVADGGGFRSLGHNLFSDAPAVPLDPADLVAVDPRLGPLADNGGPTLTMALLAGSPARDAGVALGGVTTDQRGAPRPRGGGRTSARTRPRTGGRPPSSSSPRRRSAMGRRPSPSCPAASPPGPSSRRARWPSRSSASPAPPRSTRPPARSPSSSPPPGCTSRRRPTPSPTTTPAPATSSPPTRPGAWRRPRLR
ncbi:hypothetical protein VT85_01820 [Planctomyces sp. SH-PL62]|nr:hypothetical protein VT85_01820 [Planctomyces sp. SH-PL62]